MPYTATTYTYIKNLGPWCHNGVGNNFIQAATRKTVARLVSSVCVTKRSRGRRDPCGLRAHDSVKNICCNHDASPPCDLRPSHNGTLWGVVMVRAGWGFI